MVLVVVMLVLFAAAILAAALGAPMVAFVLGVCGVAAGFVGGLVGLSR